MHIYVSIDGDSQERVKAVKLRTPPKVGRAITIELREPVDGKDRLVVKVESEEDKGKYKLYHVRRF